MRHRNPTSRGSRHTDQDEPRESAAAAAPHPAPPAPAIPERRYDADEQRRDRPGDAPVTARTTTPPGDADTEPLVLLPAFAKAGRPSRSFLPKYGVVPELVRRKPKPLWFAPQPLLLSAEESARTEQLVNDLLETDQQNCTQPESPGVRVLVGTLCTTLLLGAAAATATLTGAAPPSDDPAALAARPEPFPASSAVEAEPPAHHPAAQAALVDPAAGGERSAVTLAREFYRGVERSPALAARRLAPGVPANGRDAPWAEVTKVRPLRLHAETAHLVLATVEVAHPDGSRSVLRHRLDLSPTGRAERISVEVLSIQHFPR